VLLISRATFATILALCPVGIARADDAARGAEPSSPWLVNGSVGIGVPYTSSFGGPLTAFDIGVRHAASPDLAIGGRVVSAALLGDGVYFGVIGPDAQFWVSDHVWLGGGGGAALLVPHGGLIGAGVHGRVGASLSRSGLSPTISAGFVTTILPGEDESDSGLFTVFSVQAGVQFGGLPAHAAVREVPDQPGDARRRHGAVLIGVGTVAELGALIVGTRAMRLRDEARSYGCNDDLSGCNRDALPTAERAYDYANVATGLFVAGAAAIGVGVYLRLTASDNSATTVSPTVSNDAAGATIGGRF
jgi:hypothetical protein